MAKKMPSAGTQKAEKPLMEIQGSGIALLLILPIYTLLLKCKAYFYLLNDCGILA